MGKKKKMVIKNYNLVIICVKFRPYYGNVTSWLFTTDTPTIKYHT